MGNIPGRDLSSSAAEHLADHAKLHAFFNGFVVGPFTIAHDTAGIDGAGVELFTPAVGDWIIGLFTKLGEAWDEVDGDQIGIGIASTTDADLAMKFTPPAVAAPVYPTFPRGFGAGIPLMSEAFQIQQELPLRARCTVGGHTSGSMDLYIVTLPASLF